MILTWIVQFQTNIWMSLMVLTDGERYRKIRYDMKTEQDIGNPSGELAESAEDIKEPGFCSGRNFQEIWTLILLSFASNPK